jgi:GT2 family glycosyltransferase
MRSGSVTVVIPTHDRYGKLAVLLESVEKYRPQEIDSVIVVDDSEKPVRIASDFQSLEKAITRPDLELFKAFAGGSLAPIAERFGAWLVT